MTAIAPKISALILRDDRHVEKNRQVNVQRFRCFYSQNTQKKDQSDDADENDPSFFTSEFQLNGQHHSQEKQHKRKERQRRQEQVCQGSSAFCQLNDHHQQCGNKPGGSLRESSPKQLLFREHTLFL